MIEPEILKESDVTPARGSKRDVFGLMVRLRCFFFSLPLKLSTTFRSYLQTMRTGRRAVRTVVRQFTSAAFAFAIGVALAGGLHWLFFEPQSTRFIHSFIDGNVVLQWISTNQRYAYLAGSVLAFALILKCLVGLKRFFVSWFNGALNSFPAICLFTAVAAFTPSSDSLMIRSIGCLTAIAFVSLVLHIGHHYATRRILRLSSLPEAAKVHLQEKLQTAEFDSDEPISSWEYDLLDRAPLISILSVKLLFLKRPVIVLDGRFGSGKTSILNLLRLHLEGKAIVIFFSAWLPGSDNTLIDFLLSDVVAECRRHYMVSGLAKSTRRFASALAKSVPYLTGITELFPTPTQLDAVNDLKSSLSRVPKRVVVLIDEMDRMQRAEIIALLKLLRGVASVPNLSFVCACDKEKIMHIAGSGQGGEDTREFFEKFFLDVMPVSEPNADTLREVGIRRIVGTLASCGAFKDDFEKQSFRSSLENIWDKSLAPYCSNLRKIGILANDLHGAAGLLERNVNFVDLTLVTALRRYRPDIHTIIAGQRLILTGGHPNIKHYVYLPDNERMLRKKELAERIDALCTEGAERDRIRAILIDLFPRYSGFLGRVVTARGFGPDELQEESRISNPSIFDAYFRYEVPKDVFGAAVFEEFMESIRMAKVQEEVEYLFKTTLGTLEIGSSRREDFIYKLSLTVHTLDMNIARWLAISVMRSADTYSYEALMRLWGDSMYACRIACRTIQMLHEGDRLEFLHTCINEAGDDTMVIGLLKNITDLRESGQTTEEINRIPLRSVWDVFTARMRRRFGLNIDTSSDDVIRTSEPEAFELWGFSDLSKWQITTKASDREIRDDFWRRYIGVNKRRLAQIFEHYFWRSMQYDSDPLPFVERRISLELLRQMNFEVLPDPDLTEKEASSLRRLDRLLKGEYKNGVPFRE